MRHAGVAIRAPGAARHTAGSAAFGMSRALGRRKAAQAQPLDPVRIGIEHLELDAAGMGDHLAALRHAPGKREDEAAQRIDILEPVAGAQRRRELLFDALDRHPRVGDDAAVRPLAERRRCIGVVLVLDLADDLLDQILDGDQPVDAAELVDTIARWVRAWRICTRRSTIGSDGATNSTLRSSRASRAGRCSATGASTSLTWT